MDQELLKNPLFFTGVGIGFTPPPPLIKANLRYHIKRRKAKREERKGIILAVLW
jgi:hypothetical protein